MTPGMFLDPAALAIVFGGTALAAALRTPARDLGRTLLALRVLPRRRFRADTRLDQIAAVTFSRAAMEDDLVDTSARAHGGGRGPIEAGPVTVPAQGRGEQYFLSAKPY